MAARMKLSRPDAWTCSRTPTFSCTLRSQGLCTQDSASGKVRAWTCVGCKEARRQRSQLLAGVKHTERWRHVTAERRVAVYGSRVQRRLVKKRLPNALCQ